MRVLVAADKFKGSLTSREVRDILVEAIPGASGFLAADGGDGTLDALVEADWETRQIEVSGPTGVPNSTRVVTRAGEAAVELADACGIQALPEGRLAPLDAHTRGLGEAILAAGPVDRLMIGLGGSASTDGGTGLLAGLGARMLTHNGRAVAPGARGLVEIADLDLSGLPPWLTEAEIEILVDVTSPLLGKNGTVAVFGEQKGLMGDDAAWVEEGLATWASVLESKTGRRVRNHPGAGAAGGAGFALAALGAHMVPGAERMLEMVGFGESLGTADLVVTGEGRIDEQSLLGKTVAAVARAARWAGVPVVAVCGRNELREDELAAAGISRVHALEDLGPAENAMGEAAQRLRLVGERIAADAGLTE